MDSQDHKEIKEELKTINNQLVDVRIVQGEQHATLKEHMKRTSLNERRIMKMENFKWYFAGITVLAGAVIEIFRRFV